jgi:hypothetical protein
MEHREIETLVVKLGMFAAGLKDLGDHLAQQSQQATQEIMRSASSMATTAENTARRVSERLDTTAARAIAEGTRTATNDFAKSLLDMSNRLATTTSVLESRMISAGRLHATSAWKGLLGSGLAALVAVAAAFMLTWQALGHVQDAKWLDEVQRARARGTLQRCPEGGVCAYVNKRWHRLAL